jgi:hypothetical protein
MYVDISMEPIPDIIDMDVTLKAVMDGMSRLDREIMSDFAAVIASWDERPTPQEEPPKQTPDGARSAVFVEDEIFAMLNEGTPPHEITSRGPYPLTFRHGSGFVSKTMPGWLGSRVGQNSGDWVRKRSVMHPGTEPREWNVAIANEHIDEFVRIVVDAVDKGIAAGTK